MSTTSPVSKPPHKYVANNATIRKPQQRLVVGAHPAVMKYSGPPAPDYYPPALRSEIDALSANIDKRINMGVYLAGFAKAQVSISFRPTLTVHQSQSIVDFPSSL